MFADSGFNEIIAVLKYSTPYSAVKLNLHRLKITTKFSSGNLSNSSARIAKFYLSLSDGLARYSITNTHNDILKFAICLLYLSVQSYNGKFGSFQPGESIKIVSFKTESFAVTMDR